MRDAGVSLLGYDENEKNNFQYVVTKIDSREAGLDRDELLSVLHAENVMARRYFYRAATGWSHIAHYSERELVAE